MISNFILLLLVKQLLAVKEYKEFLGEPENFSYNNNRIFSLMSQIDAKMTWQLNSTNENLKIDCSTPCFNKNLNTKIAFC